MTFQTWDPQGYDRHARFVSDLGMSVVEWLAPQSGERILDLGCGDGALTAKLVALGCRVVGVDASLPFLRAARALGLDVLQMDGQVLAFAGGFDAVFTNAALHWMKRPDDVLDGAWRALRPGGRLVGEFGGQGNVAAIVGALHRGLARRGLDPVQIDPWYMPGVDEYRARLEARGFAVRRIALIPRPTPLPGDLLGWLETFAQAFAAALPFTERSAYLDKVRAEAAPALRAPDGRWVADYVRLRFEATRPA